MLSEERKERIRNKNIESEREYLWADNRKLYYSSYLKNKHKKFHELIRSGINVGILDGTPAIIDEDDLIAGRLDFRPKNDAETEELIKRCEAMSEIGGTGSHATTHRALDYEKLLKKGINGILAEVREYQKNIDFSDPDCTQKRIFYKACADDLEAALRFNQRYYEEAVRLRDAEKNPERRKELEEMANALKVVPANPATTFREALQSVWLLTVMLFDIEESIQAGRPDNYLYPYYKNDIEKGIITDDEVFSLIEDWYFRIDHFEGTKRRGVFSLMVGGRNRDGEPVWNELTYMFVRAIETVGLINPSVAVAYNEAMPDDLLELCLEIVGKGYTKPPLFNDDIIIKGLKEAGVDEKDANYYIHSTCVEITTVGNSNIRVATPYLNINKSFEYLLNDGKEIYAGDREPGELETNGIFETPYKADITTLDTFEKFYDATKRIIKDMILAELAVRQEWVLNIKRYCSLPLASCFVDDCLALGMDCATGGSRYNFYYPCFPGFTNFVDSVVAIKKAVYEEKLVTLEDLADALRSNFEGAERLQAYLRNKCPKFGNDIDEVDVYAKDMFEFLKDEIGKFANCIRNATFYPSYFAYLHHGRLGGECAATPDGRKAGEALSECLGAVQGMDINGPVALMHSVAKIPQHYGIGGIATNVRFSKKLMKENLQEVKAYVKEFMREGNFEIQFNVIDQATLADAQKHPEKYRTLMVRVAGYSDYFVNLPHNIQEEIMKRLEHGDL